KNNELSENIRTIAGLKIVSHFIDNLQLSKLISFSQNEKLPETVRNIAKDNIESVGIQYVEKLAQKGDFDKLMSIAENNELPESIRISAMNKVTNNTQNKIAGDGILSEVNPKIKKLSKRLLIKDKIGDAKIYNDKNKKTPG
ncbi:MAG: hypothetical protein QXI17_04200, partial [Candidatus Bilamarchaeaceae archaeon]